MAVSMTQKKKDFLNALIGYADRAAVMVREVQELNSYFNDNGFQTAGANPIVDADCTDGAAHLTAALVNSAMTAIINVNLNGSQKTTLRQVAAVPVPK